jgi:hypothetical protein
MHESAGRAWWDRKQGLTGVMRRVHAIIGYGANEKRRSESGVCEGWNYR